MKHFDWPTIRSCFERGMGATEIANTLPECPTRQAIEKRARKEGWEVACLPDNTSASELTGVEATKAVILQKIRRGVPLGLAARSAGIHENTLYNWRQGDVVFSEACQAARAAFISTNIERIDKAGGRDWKAASYLIERAPETRDQFGSNKSEAGLTIVLQIDRSEGITVEHDPK